MTMSAVVRVGGVFGWRMRGEGGVKDRGTKEEGSGALPVLRVSDDKGGRQEVLESVVV